VFSSSHLRLITGVPGSLNGSQTAILSARVMPFLHLGPVDIPTYGLMVALAMLAAYLVLRADFARRGIGGDSSSASVAELFIAIPSVCGIVGARLYHVLESPHDLMADPWGLLFSRYGLAWFGGLIAGAAAWCLLAYRRKIPLLDSLDAGSPAAALGYGIGRIGCLLSGDGDYGKPTSLPWGMSFPNGLVPTTERVHPTPLYEFGAALVIAWLLWRFGVKQLQTTAPRRSSGAAPPGSVFGLYLVLTGLARFLVEFIRINPRSLLGMTNAQVAASLSILAGALLLWQAKRLNREVTASR
jgi:phosphatidylglycerol:prolipoprotein diacylglycerol transferase